MRMSISPQDATTTATLIRGREFSLAWLAAMQAALETLPGIDRDVVSVVAAGSVGRLEASEWSDADVIVIVSEAVFAEPESAQAWHQEIYQTLTNLGLRLPKNWGIFTSPTAISELCAPAALGCLAESPRVFGKRMQLLLDSRAAWSSQGLEQVQAAILSWYATGFLAHDLSREWTHLLNDLMRYWRSYCAWQQFELKVEADDSWLTRNVKLTHSRLMNYAGLLLLLGEASREGQNKREWLAAHLGLTPLQRVQLAYERHADPGFAIIADHYAEFLRAMEDGALRDRLVADSPRTLAELPPQETPDYQRLYTGSRAISAELTRFIFARRSDWSPRFVEYLLF